MNPRRPRDRNRRAKQYRQEVGEGKPRLRASHRILPERETQEKTQRETHELLTEKRKEIIWQWSWTRRAMREEHSAANPHARHVRGRRKTFRPPPLFACYLLMLRNVFPPSLALSCSCLWTPRCKITVTLFCNLISVK